MSETTPPAAVTRKKKRTLTPKEREEAVALWAAGEGTLDSLASKFKVAKRTLQNLFDARGVKKGELAEKIAAQAKLEMERLLREHAATLAGKAFETKKELHDLIRFATKKIGALMLEAQKNNRSMATLRADIQTLREAINAFKTAQETQFPLLGIREDDPAAEVYPELQIVELSDEEIREGQAKRMGDLGDISGEKLDEVNAALDKELKA